jgi:hypothetical protein
VNQNFIGGAIAMVMPAAIATGIFSSLATFQSPSADYDSAGAWDGTWANVAGLVDIPCTAPPISDAKITATEARQLQEILASEFHHVLLAGYYPALDAGWRGTGSPAGAWRVLIDGEAFEIAGVESDSQSQMTRVTARISTL